MMVLKLLFILRRFFGILFGKQCLSDVFLKNPVEKFGCKFLPLYLSTFNRPEENP